MWLITITGVMILPPYLASTAYLWKYANQASYHARPGETRFESVVTGILGTVYAVWLLYAAILQGRHFRWFAPKRVAALCVLAFSAAISVLWAINFVSQNHPMQ